MPKLLLRTLSLAALSVLALSVTANASALTFGQARDIVGRLAMQRTWAANCPYSAENKELLDSIANKVFPTLGLTPDDLQQITGAYEAKALGDISVQSTRVAICHASEGSFEKDAPKLRDYLNVLKPQPITPPK
jgi:hypothetical protein